MFFVCVFFSGMAMSFYFCNIFVPFPPLSLLSYLQCRYLDPWEDSPSDSSRIQGWSPCELPYNLFGSPFLLPLLQASLGSTRTIQHHHICLAWLALLVGAVVPFCHHSLQIVENAIVATYVFFLPLMSVCVRVYIYNLSLSLPSLLL